MVRVMFCNTCGASNPDAGRFCSQCGKPLASPRPNPGETRKDWVGTSGTSRPAPNASPWEAKVRSNHRKLWVIITVAVISLVILSLLTKNSRDSSSRDNQQQSTKFAPPEETRPVEQGRKSVLPVTRRVIVGWYEEEGDPNRTLGWEKNSDKVLGDGAIVSMHVGANHLVELTELGSSLVKVKLIIRAGLTPRMDSYSEYIARLYCDRIAGLRLDRDGEALESLVQRGFSDRSTSVTTYDDLFANLKPKVIANDESNSGPTLEYSGSIVRHDIQVTFTKDSGYGTKTITFTPLDKPTVPVIAELSDDSATAIDLVQSRIKPTDDLRTLDPDVTTTNLSNEFKWSAVDNKGWCGDGCWMVWCEIKPRKKQKYIGPVSGYWDVNIKTKTLKVTDGTTTAKFFAITN